MNICFLVKRYYTNKDLLNDKFGRLYYIPVELQRAGHKCSVFAFDYRNNKLDIKNHDNVTFYNIPLFSLNLFRGIKRLLKKRKENVDIVCASGDIYIGLLGYWLAKFNKASYIFDLYDNYLSFKYNQNFLMKYMQSQVMQKADMLVFASNHLRMEYPAYINKSLTVENSVDPTIFHPLSADYARKSIDLQDSSPVIGYFGMLRKRRGINELFQAMHLVRKEFPQAMLLLAGAKDDDIDISPGWIKYIGSVSQDQVNLLINASDVVVLPYLKDEFTEMTNACKLNEYIACKKPFVVTDISDYKTKYYQDSPQCIAEPGNADSLAEAILYQLKNRRIMQPDFPITWAENVRPLSDMILS